MQSDQSDETKRSGLSRQAGIFGILGLTAALFVVAFNFPSAAPDAAESNTGGATANESMAGSRAVATFAGGCFWCMEHPYDVLDGVYSTTSGYIGGSVDNPGYRAVSTGKTGHTEAVQVEYDPTKVSYETLLHIFWRNIDPLTPNAQFCDHGSQYRTGIFFHSSEQEAAARASKAELSASGRFSQPIVTEITSATMFYPAEDYHQDYYLKNPIRYKFYRRGCGRDKRLADLWGEEAPH